MMGDLEHVPLSTEPAMVATLRSVAQFFDATK